MFAGVPSAPGQPASQEGSSHPGRKEGRKDTACSQEFDPIKCLGRHRAVPAASRATFARGVGEGPAPSDLTGHPELLLPPGAALAAGCWAGGQAGFAHPGGTGSPSPSCPIPVSPAPTLEQGMPGPCHSPGPSWFQHSRAGGMGSELGFNPPQPCSCPGPRDAVG